MHIMARALAFVGMLVQARYTDLHPLSCQSSLYFAYMVTSSLSLANGRSINLYPRAPKEGEAP